MIGNTQIIASSEDKKYTYIPKGYEIPSDADYLHLTSNNTIYGTQMKSFPKSNIPLICDMSSDIFSRKVNAKDFTLIYAGAQKNMGAAGNTMVMVKKDALGKSAGKCLACWIMNFTLKAKYVQYASCILNICLRIYLPVA